MYKLNSCKNIRFKATGHEVTTETTDKDIVDDLLMIENDPTSVVDKPVDNKGSEDKSFTINENRELVW